MHLEDVGVIGNCQFAALVHRAGAVVFCCLPRFDAEPLFAALLDPDGGSLLAGAADGSLGTQRYLDNTNVLETRFELREGSFRVLDFAPRYPEHEHMVRPTKIVRILEPLSGTPRVRVRADPRLGWQQRVPARDVGSNHVTYLGFPAEVRLTTDVPLSYLEGQPFALTEKKHIVLAWGDPVREPLAALCDRMLVATSVYWQRWVKHCGVPPLFQREVIRSALALKLHCFEDTGAIVASLTSSIPEAPEGGRSWDQRYCFLRDAAYALDAFRLLGHFEERERFVGFLLDIAGGSRDLDLPPIVRIDGRTDLEPEEIGGLAGYEGRAPVRVGSDRVRVPQHDVLGEMVLALSPVFLDDRFRAEQTRATLDLGLALAHKATRVAGTPDADFWNVQRQKDPQTFSAIMCWAAADRMAKVCARHLPERRAELTQAADRLRAQILDRAYDPRLNTLVASYGGSELDAALLQAVTLRFLPPDDPAMHGTIDAIVSELSHGQRYRLSARRAPSGANPTAYLIATFWLIEALAVVGRASEARDALGRASAALAPLGLMSETWDTRTMRMYGNFPRAHSHVGLIHAAFAASPHWDEVL